MSHRQICDLCGADITRQDKYAITLQIRTPLMQVINIAHDWCDRCTRDRYPGIDQIPGSYRCKAVSPASESEMLHTAVQNIVRAVIDEDEPDLPE